MQAACYWEEKVTLDCQLAPHASMAVLAQGGERVGPAEADHAGEGVAGGAVTRGVIGRQRIPAAMFDGDPRSRRHGFEPHLDFGEVAGREAILPPFDYQAMGRLPC